MTDHWEFFPCMMGEHHAFVFTNVGIKDRLSEVVPECLFKVRLDYKTPTDKGLPTEHEYEPARAIEDELLGYVHARGDFYVGRITVSGQRHFFVYVGSWDGYEQRVAEIGKVHGYALMCASVQDPGHSQYWSSLWPSDSDWQIIHDRRALEALKNEGDEPCVERDVDHWITFDDSGAATQYRDWALQYGLEEVCPIESLKDRFLIRLKHHGTMFLGDLSALTIPLALKAKEMGGDYDGWETSVMRSSQHNVPSDFSS